MSDGVPAAGELRVFPIRSVPEVRPGDDLGGMIADAAIAEGNPLRDGDVVVEV